MEKTKAFLLGMLAAIALMFLVGGTSLTNQKYQIAVGKDTGEIFIVNTQTGVTKEVYKSYFGKPFDQMPPN